MIYTLTLNPSVDYIVELNEVQLGGLNRMNRDTKFPGGKGINVSRVLKQFEVESTATGYLGGFTGRYIEEYLQLEQIKTDFIHVEEDTRINIKLKAQVETEINASGPQITDESFQNLLKKIHAFTKDDLLVLAGSIPRTMPNATYEEIVKVCQKNGTAFVVDAEGELLQNVLPYQPLLIKPNHHELGELFDTTISTVEEAIPYGKQLLEMGAENIIVSLAEKGAIFMNKELTFIANVPKGDVKSSVGAGDSMVAGFVAKLQKTGDVEAAFRYSVAAGSATAFSLGLCTKEKVTKLVQQIVIRKI
ncbi:1-phosphofructokinase [Cytobacillus spongiae]|uniref:1-phosphofructokinase n=1 Tax=Cytobacillus spongiae TaxID=2901381 RepID=UPI001F1C1CF0|nr:1-phosphofructokinase [Cytobacillus spongiae]UII54386.1 1-phosphofructokinase [Cytobacillus spongiae]